MAAPAPEPEPAPVAAQLEAGWVRRLVCDVIDISVLSTLRAGVAAHFGVATGYLALMLEQAGIHSHPFQSFSGWVWLGPLGIHPLARLRFVSDFVVGSVYWLGCHAALSRRSVGMCAARVRLVRAKDGAECGKLRLLLRFLIEFLSSSAATRWAWWVGVDLLFLLVYRGSQYLQDVGAGTAVLADG